MRALFSAALLVALGCSPLPLVTDAGGDASVVDGADGASDGADDAVLDAAADDDGGPAIPTTPWVHDVIAAGSFFSVAVDPTTKRVVAAGYGYQPVQTVVVSSFAADGTAEWQKILPQGVAMDVTLDASGNAYVIGSSNGVDLGGGTIGVGSFCVKYDPAGNYVWGYGPIASSLNRVKLLSNGDVVLAGMMTGSDDFGAGAVSPIGATDALAIELDSSGKYVRAGHWGTASGHATIQSFAVDAQDRLLFGGYYQGSIDFGGGAMIAMSDNFLVELDSTFSFVRQMPLKSASSGIGDVAFDSGGNVLAAVAAVGAVTLGGVTIPGAGQYGQIVFAKLDSSLGMIWHDEHAGTLGVYSTRVSVTQKDEMIATGYYAGVIDLGKGNLPTGSSQTLFFARLDSSGNTLSTLGLGAPNTSTEGYGAIYMMDSDYVVAGNCSGTTTLPMLPSFECSQDRDAIVARIPIP